MRINAIHDRYHDKENSVKQYSIAILPQKLLLPKSLSRKSIGAVNELPICRAGY